MFIIDGVCLAYSELEVLSEFSLESSGHEFICLFGPSGIGKTSILNMLAGIIKPQKGQVKCRHSRIGYVFQEPRLLPWLRVCDNIELGLFGLKIDSLERSRRVASMMERTGLDKFHDYYPGQLSGGMKQRVSLGRAFAVQPDLLLMDEPFSSLDASLKQEMRQLLQELIAWQPCTTVFVTHDVKEGIQLADRIVALGGRPCRILECYSPEKERLQEEQYCQQLATSIMKDTFTGNPEMAAEAIGG